MVTKCMPECLQTAFGQIHGFRVLPPIKANVAHVTILRDD